VSRTQFRVENTLKKILLLILIVLILLISSANCVEPAHYSKLDITRAVELCQAPWTPLVGTHVVKPVRGSYQGHGVDFESSSWTVAVCESITGLPCGRQLYHPGPWEARMYKSGTWRPTIAWNVPSSDPHAFTTIFPWEATVQACIDAVLPHSPALAVDLRTDGHTVRILEVNGAYGLGMSVHGTGLDDVWHWGVSRAAMGAHTLYTCPTRSFGWGRDLRNAMDRVMSRTPSKVWF